MRKWRVLLTAVMAVVMTLGAGAVPALTAAAETPDVTGAVRDGAYINEYFDIAFAPPSDWVFASDEELLQILGLTVDVVSKTDAGEAVKEFVESETGSCVMYACSPDGMDNVNVIVQDLSCMGLIDQLVTEDDLISLSFGENGMAMWQSMGLEDFYYKPGTAAIAGQEHDCMILSYNSAVLGMDADVIQQILFLVRDGYSFQITMTSHTDAAALDDIAAMFTSAAE